MTSSDRDNLPVALDDCPKGARVIVIDDRETLLAKDTEHARSFACLLPSKMAGVLGVVIEAARPPSKRCGSVDPIVRLADGRVVSVKVWALRFVPTPDECKTCSCDGGTPRKLLGGATSGWRYEQWHCFKCRTYRIFSRLQVNTKKVRT